MGHTSMVAASQLGGTGLLDWIIGTGFSVVVLGVPCFRLLAIWRGWMSDD
ncbi:hypothetical protein Mycsm_04037 [Mycobacterium sp. JS623]|nr:hypothetical protein Mycsm_04037 [Mycobacterium sp. JS623]